MASGTSPPRRLGALLAGVLLVAAPARAQDRGGAEQLFQHGKEAMARKDIPQACKYFQASLEADFALGTLLNLAICHEQEGKKASAYAEFRVIEDRAVRAVPPQTDRAEYAHKRVEALKGDLLHVRIRPPDMAKGLKGFVVKIDRVPIDELLFGPGAPVDPGEHRLVAEAPDHEPREIPFTAKAVDVTVDIPPLVKIKKPPTRAQIDLAEAERQASARSRRTAGIVVGGVGAGALVTGIVFGLLAKHADGQTGCPAPCYLTSDTYQKAHDAYGREKTFAWISDVGYGVGVLGLGIGSYLFVTAQRRLSTKAALRLGPTGFVLEGSL